MCFFLFAGNAQRLYKNKADDAQNNRNRKNNVVAESFVKEHSRHGASRKSEVHADAEIADAFAAATSRERVDCDRITCGCRDSKEKSMRKSHHCENRQKPDSLVPDKAKRKREERPKVKRFAAERIDEESCKRAASESANRVKRYDDARSRIVGRKLVNNVQREYRQQLIKAKKQKKVRGRARYKVARPKCRFLVRCNHNQIPH